MLRPEAVQALQGSELIIHAGDVRKPEILDDLRKIAPVAAIRGNVDNGVWAQGLPQTRTVEIGRVRIYVIHNIDDLSVDAAAAGCVAVVSGQPLGRGLHRVHVTDQLRFRRRETPISAQLSCFIHDCQHAMPCVRIDRHVGFLHRGPPGFWVSCSTAP